MLHLEATRRLHDQLVDRWHEEPETFRRAWRSANEQLQRRQLTFERTKPLTATPTALVLSGSDAASLRHLAESLHAIVEKALNWITADRRRLQRYFPDHQRVFDYVQKTAGLSTWQGYSRYDAVVTAEGQVKVIELNTACPAGFLHSESFSEIAKRTLESLGVGHIDGATKYGSVPANTLVDELLAIEARSNVEMGLVGLVNDENQLLNELDLFADAFERRGRRVSIINASELDFAGSCFQWCGQPVSLTMNKVRVSTEHSPGHHWRAGFDQRYAGFLAGLAVGTVASVNNLCCLTIGEDKGLLSVLREPELWSTLDEEERRLVDEHVLWTRRLEDGRVTWRDQSIDLLPFVREHREQFVIKPANEGRGFRVVVGKYATEAEWMKACRRDPSVPSVVQEYAEPCRLPVVATATDGGEAAQSAALFLTIGMAMVGGRYRGLVSRVSPNPVTNVGREGSLQAVLIRGEETGRKMRAGR